MPAVYLIPNLTTAPRDPAAGEPVLLYSTAFDAMSVAFVEVALPPS